MKTNILYTADLCKSLMKQVSIEVKKLQKQGLTPGFVVIQVGNNPISSIYVKKKQEIAKKSGIICEVIHLDENITSAKLEIAIEKQAIRDEIHSIILQLPLPEKLQNDCFKFINHIPQVKDVDGLTQLNAGKMECAAYDDGLLPATPLGILRILKWQNIDVAGKEIVIIGRGPLVGRPLACLLGEREATVTVCHQKTRCIPSHLQKADIIIAAAGAANLVKGEYLKKGAVVIDVGISTNLKTGKVTGDVDTKSCEGIAKFVTPMPGGVGPMTVASLITNVVDSCCIQSAIPRPVWKY